MNTNFDDFLKDEGIYEECCNTAILKTITDSLLSEMKKRKLTKIEVAKQLKTSRSALDRLLTPNNKSITLQTLLKAATFLGKELHIELVDRKTHDA